MTNAEYLGDGVYAQVREEDGSVVLTTGAHFDSQRYDNSIYLDSKVQEALMEYLRKIRLI
jgi:hypothetical protein